MPLFARKGFAATTVKDIAEAAGVSEALLYKHFRSKTELYQAILEQGHREDDSVAVFLRGLKPSTEHLVFAVKLFIQFSVQPPVPEMGPDSWRRRLMLNSLLEDGEFARIVSDKIIEFIAPRIEASLQAAIAAGDARPTGLDVRDAVWALYQLASMVGCVGLANRQALPHPDRPDRDVRSLTAFVLRGMGLTEAAITAHVDTPLPDVVVRAAENRFKEAS